MTRYIRNNGKNNHEFLFDMDMKCLLLVCENVTILKWLSKDIDKKIVELW